MLLKILMCLLLWGVVLGAKTPGKPLIVLSTPLSDEHYYAKIYNQTVDFMIVFAKKIIAQGENVIVFGDGATLKKIGDQLSPGHILLTEVYDLWIRDFGSSIAKDPVLFTYTPDFVDRADAVAIQKSFIDSMRKYGITPYFSKSSLIVDGGNIVDDGRDTLVTTSRTRKDNPTVDIKAELRAQTSYPYIVEIEEIMGDPLGHAGGMVSWMDNNTLVLSQLDPHNQEIVLKQLKEQLPTDKLLRVIPNIYVNDTWKQYTSACGRHINSLVTTHSVYVPTFGDDPENSADGRPYTKAYDQEVLDVIYNITTKNVVQVPVPYNVCRMGGSARLLTWQVDGEIAGQIINAAESYANKHIIQ